MELYPWVVIGHVVFVIVGFGAHGVSAYAMFRARSEPDRARLAAILDLSATSANLAGLGLLLAVVLGIVAAIQGDHFAKAWPWASIVLFVLVFGAMRPFAAKPMNEVRKALGMRVQGDKKDAPPREPGPDGELAAARAKLRPEIVATIGVVGIVLLVWMMEVKPF